MSATSELVYWAEDFPRGLRCMDCNHLFTDGEAYSERLEAMVDGWPVVELMCVPCGMRLA